MTRTASVATLLVGSLLAVLYVVAAVEGSPDASNLAQLVGGSFPVLIGLSMARGAGPDERRWRLLVVAGMAFWTAGQVVWSWYWWVWDRQPDSPSWADAGYLGLPCFVLVGMVLLVRSREDRAAVAMEDRAELAWRRNRAVTVVCLLVLVGAVFLVTWSSGGPQDTRTDAGADVVADAYLITDLMAVVTAGLLGLVWGLPRRQTRELRVLALGLLSLAVADGRYAYLVRLGQEQYPLSDVGFVLGPFLIGVALGLAPVGGEHPRTPRTAMRETP